MATQRSIRFDRTISRPFTTPFISGCRPSTRTSAAINRSSTETLTSACANTALVAIRADMSALA
jgi:hypothetical protein